MGEVGLRKRIKIQGPCPAGKVTAVDRQGPCMYITRQEGVAGAGQVSII